jgi:hypothetical protein
MLLEPNGFSYEDCGEFRVDKLGGQWNDYSCSQALPSVCEKRGSNYVEPPKPIAPKPTCPDGWRDILGRCIYYSPMFTDYAFNWTEAREKCRSVLPGATLASIRDQADQDAFYGRTIAILLVWSKLTKLFFF